VCTLFISLSDWNPCAPPIREDVELIFFFLELLLAVFWVGPSLAVLAVLFVLDLIFKFKILSNNNSDVPKVPLSKGQFVAQLLLPRLDHLRETGYLILYGLYPVPLLSGALGINDLVVDY